MSNLRKSLPAGLLAVLCLSVLFSMTALAAEETAEYVPAMYATFWALVPPIVAIGQMCIRDRIHIDCHQCLKEYIFGIFVQFPSGKE